MSPEDRNVAILRNAYQTWHDTKAGSVDCWLGFIADELNFGSLAQGRPDSLAFTCTRNTREGVASYLCELTRDWEMIDYVVDNYVAQGDRVVAIGRTSWRNRSTGKVADSPKCDVWRFNAAGQAIEFFEYYDTAALIDATRPSPLSA